MYYWQSPLRNGHVYLLLGAGIVTNQQDREMLGRKRRRGGRYPFVSVQSFSIPPFARSHLSSSRLPPHHLPPGAFWLLLRLLRGAPLVLLRVCPWWAHRLN